MNTMMDRTAVRDMTPTVLGLMPFGLLIGLTHPLVGRLAGAGLLLLLAGALATHLRHRDGLRELAPAAVCAALVAGYLIALAGGMP